jgi:hypothetical protein
LRFLRGGYSGHEKEEQNGLCHGATIALRPPVEKPIGRFGLLVRRQRLLYNR